MPSRLSASPREAEVPTARGMPARARAATKVSTPGTGSSPRPANFAYRSRLRRASRRASARLTRRPSSKGRASSAGRPMVSRQNSGCAGATRSSSSRARQAFRWCAPLSMRTPSMSKRQASVTVRMNHTDRDGVLKAARVRPPYGRRYSGARR